MTMTVRPLLKKSYAFAFFAATVMTIASPVFSQDVTLKEECIAPPLQTITTLPQKNFGVPPLWDASYENGHDGSFYLADGLPLKDGTVLITGMTYKSMTATDGNKSTTFETGRAFAGIMPDSVVIVQLNQRGRTVTEKLLPARPYEKIAAMRKIGNHYIIASDYKENDGKAGRLGLRWLNEDGNIVREVGVADPQYSYEAIGIAPAVAGNGFILYAQATAQKEPGSGHSKIFAYDGKGTLLWSRALRPGIPNKISFLSPMNDKGHYLATGQIRMDDGRMAGWIMELDEKGALLWQQSYPRGDGADIHAGTLLPEDEGLVFAGVAAALDDGGSAAWIMKTGTDGTPEWQRYLRQDGYALSARHIRREKDGRLIIMQNADPTDPATEKNANSGRHYIRMLTLSPHGDIIQDEPYIDGIHAHGRTLRNGQDSARVIFGNIIENFSPPIGKASMEAEQNMPDSQTLPKRMLGWVIYAKPPASYDDPCPQTKQDRP